MKTYPVLHQPNNEEPAVIPIKGSKPNSLAGRDVSIPSHTKELGHVFESSIPKKQPGSLQNLLSWFSEKIAYLTGMGTTTTLSAEKKEKILQVTDETQQILKTEKVAGKTVIEILNPFIEREEFLIAYSRFIKICHTAQETNLELQTHKMTLSKTTDHNLAMSKSAVPVLTALQGYKHHVTKDKISILYDLISAVTNASLLLY